MLFKVVVRGAAGLAAALVFLGANVEWNPVKAVPIATPENVASMCVKVDAQNYGYCCKLRLESSCPSVGKHAVKQSKPFKLAPLNEIKPTTPLRKLSELGGGNEDINGDSPGSSFGNGDTVNMGRGLAANNGGADGGAGSNGGASDGANNGGANGGDGPGTDGGLD